MQTAVDTEIRREHEVKDRRHGPREPRYVAEDGGTTHQSHRHDSTLHTGGTQQPAAKPTAPADGASAHGPRGAALPGHDPQLRSQQEGVRQRATLPDVERREARHTGRRQRLGDYAQAKEPGKPP